MFYDEMYDANDVLIFKLIRWHLVNILASMTEEARTLYTIKRGQNGERYSVQEYLDFWD